MEDINKSVLESVKDLESIFRLLSEKYTYLKDCREVCSVLEGVLARSRQADTLIATWGSEIAVGFMGFHAVKSVNKENSLLINRALLLDINGIENALRRRAGNPNNRRRRVRLPSTELSYALYLGFLIKSAERLGVIEQPEGRGYQGFNKLKLFIEGIVNRRIPGRMVLGMAEIGKRMIEIYLSPLKPLICGQTRCQG